MKKYEYKSVKLPIDPQQLQAMSMGVVPSEQVDDLTAAIVDEMNEHGGDGWRIMQPLVLPVLWLEREKPRNTSTTKKAKEK